MPIQRAYITSLEKRIEVLVRALQNLLDGEIHECGVEKCRFCGLTWPCPQFKAKQVLDADYVVNLTELIVDNCNCDVKSPGK